MTHKNLQGLKVRDYKCFLAKNDHQGFDEIKSINVLIGKNNSGKSKLIEFVREFIREYSEKPTIDIKNNSRIFVRKILEENELKTFLREGTSGGTYAYLSNGEHWSNIGKKLVGKTFLCSSGKMEILDPPFELNNERRKNAFNQILSELMSRIANPLNGYECLVIQAERNLGKEGVNFNDSNSQNYMVMPDGRQLTQLLVRCLNEEKGHAEKWQEFVESELLSKINSVLQPDLHFTRILAKIDTNQTWELYFEEEKKGGIKLSDCGSGLKTVIMVMTMLYIIPRFKKGRKFAFIFEELENNLHPSLERKLLAHVRDYLKNNPSHLLFLTTHSNIAIDMFSKDEDAQILRCFNDGEASFVEKVNNWNDHNNLLDDLGVKASDVLQSNCLIWLEGPSDRIYFNKWMQLFNQDEPLEEGLHYQCLFYGGSTLSHYSASPDLEDEFIKMLRINRNAVIIMDSDRANSGDGLKPRVQKILQAAEGVDSLLTWVTEGREVENYLPNDILSEYFEQQTSLGKYDLFENKFKTARNVKSFDKVKFASDVTSLPSFDAANLNGHLDIARNMAEIITHIRRCNQ